MIHNKSQSFLFSLLLLSTAYCHAGTEGKTRHPLYAGLIGGYGSTTWQGLVPAEKDKSLAMMMSTPETVDEGGFTWGFLAGYEFSPYFALEANYMRYPDSHVYYNTKESLFSFTHNGLGKFRSKTDSISLIAKIMMTIPKSNFRIFSDAGVARLYRNDMLLDDSRITPTFGAGVNYDFTDHIMGEIAGNYTAGFGQSQLNPADGYFPFLYSVTARLAYRF